MNIDKLTTKSQEVLQKAQMIAEGEGHQAIETGHFLKAMLESDQSILPYLLKECNINPDSLKNTVDSIVSSYPKVIGGQVYLSNNANKLIASALKLSESLKDEFISTEVLFLGMLSLDDSIGKLLKDLGLEQNKLKEAIMKLRNGDSVTSQGQESTYQSLAKYANDLNEMAKNGKKRNAKH